jgi:hypothetical protein
MDATTWRSPHLHFIVRAIGFKTLVTQLFFAGAVYLDTDPFVKKSLIMPLREHTTGTGTYKTCMCRSILRWGNGAVTRLRAESCYLRAGNARYFSRVP